MSVEIVEGPVGGSRFQGYQLTAGLSPKDLPPPDVIQHDGKIYGMIHHGGALPLATVLQKSDPVKIGWRAIQE